MKAKMQSLHLQQMMQKHKRHPEYDLVLSPFLLKKKNISALKEGDVLLLGLGHLELCLYQDGTFCAHVGLDHAEERVKIEIKNLKKLSDKESNSKKYENVMATFGKIQSRQLEPGHKVEISMLDLQEAALTVDGVNMAKAALVMVDEEIALKITKVYNWKK